MDSPFHNFCTCGHRHFQKNRSSIFCHKLKFTYTPSPSYSPCELNSCFYNSTLTNAVQLHLERSPPALPSRTAPSRSLVSEHSAFPCSFSPSQALLSSSFLSLFQNLQAPTLRRRLSLQEAFPLPSRPDSLAPDFTFFLSQLSLGAQTRRA